MPRRKPLQKRGAGNRFKFGDTVRFAVHQLLDGDAGRSRWPRASCTRRSGSASRRNPIRKGWMCSTKRWTMSSRSWKSSPGVSAAPPIRCRLKCAPDRRTALAIRWIIGYSLGALREDHGREAGGGISSRLEE